MNRITNYRLLLGILSLLMLSSCKRTEYTHAIPADISGIMTIDVKTIAGKSGINEESNASLKQHLVDALKNGLNTETSERLAKVMDKPSKTGFDFSKPIYVFTAKEFDNSPVIDICVDDKGDLTSTLEALSKSQLCTLPQKTDNFKFSVINGNLVIAYNRGTALLVRSSQGMTDVLVSKLNKVMTMEKRKSFAATKAFDALGNEKGNIAFYTTSKAIEASKDFSITGNVNFLNGRILVKLKNSSNTKSNALIPIKNTFLSYFPQNMPVMLTMGMNGQETYKQFIGEMGIDAFDAPIFEKIFESVKGDMTIGYNNFDKKNASFLAYAQVNNSSTLKAIYDSMKALKNDVLGKVEQKGTMDYVYHFMGKNIFYGCNGNIMYITDDAALVHYKSAGSTYLQNPYAKQIIGKKFFFAVNAEQMADVLQQSKRINGTVSSLIKNNIVDVKGYNVSPDAYDVEINWRNKNINVVKQIVNIVRQVAGF